MAAGLEQALDFLENLQFSKEEIDWLRQNYRFTDGFLDYLGSLRFTGDVDAMPEGTIFFANEPIIRVTAPLPAGPTGRNPPDQHPSFSIGGRLEGGANGPCRTGQAADRFRASARAWSRSGADGGARQLSGGICRNGNASCTEGFRNSSLRDDGPFFHPGARRRNLRIFSVCPLAAGQSRLADRHLRYGSRRPKGRQTGTSSEGSRELPCTGSVSTAAI